MTSLKYYTRFSLTASVLFIFALFSAGNTIKDKQHADLCKFSKLIIDNFDKENFDEIAESVTPNLHNALNAEALQRAWKHVENTCGSYKTIDEIQIASYSEELDSILLTCDFSFSKVEIRITVNSRLEIVGLFLYPQTTQSIYAEPDYINNCAINEQHVAIGEHALPGVLTLPQGAGPFPAIILLHGSGPIDKDATLGPNKPFCDIAGGLASQGVAVLRYDKRTYAHPELFAQGNFTVEEEVIADANSAIAFLRRTKGISPKQVFVLGHSFGGFILPRIAEKQTSIAGLIFLAAGSRHVEDILLEQVSYIINLDETISAEEKKYLEELARAIAEIQSPDLNANTPNEKLLFNIPASYWLDMRNYDPLNSITNYSGPMLFLQGCRDYQVTETDLNNWKYVLQNRENVSFRIFPQLNHLFFSGKGIITPEEYCQSGQVSEIIIDSLANWIHKQTTNANSTTLSK